MWGGYPGVVLEALGVAKRMDLLVAFEMAWGHWAQYPESVKCDAGTHFQGIFAGFFQALGVPIANTGTEAH